MQAKKLTVKNIGILTDIEIEINKPLIIFYGDIRQGKTTILESIKLLFGGGFSKDLIRHGEKEAFVKLELDNGYIKREWYRSKENEVKSRQIEFVRDGELVKGQIVNELANYVNPFLLDQNYFRKMNKIDKAKFLLEIFGVDISDLKKENGELELKARELRQKIKMYGDIDLTEVKKPDIDSLKSREQEIRMELNTKYSENKKYNSDLRAKYEANKETQRQ
ncbi:MAG: AAA family ATPase, partial [Bacteroidetes bacterium]|nr:AAA family ATPase [Bacteroidota bacterium]